MREREASPFFLLKWKSICQNRVKTHECPLWVTAKNLLGGSALQAVPGLKRGWIQAILVQGSHIWGILTFGSKVDSWEMWTVWQVSQGVSCKDCGAHRLTFHYSAPPPHPSIRAHVWDVEGPKSNPRPVQLKVLRWNWRRRLCSDETPES